MNLVAMNHFLYYVSVSPTFRVLLRSPQGPEGNIQLSLKVYYLCLSADSAFR